MIAGCTTLDFLKDGNVYISIDKLGKRIRDGLDEILQRGTLSATITGVGSLFAIHFQAKMPKNAGDTVYNDMATTKAYFTYMLDRGIAYLSPTMCHCWISAPHTKEDIDTFITATEDFVKVYRT